MFRRHLDNQFNISSQFTEKDWSLCSTLVCLPMILEDFNFWKHTICCADTWHFLLMSLFVCLFIFFLFLGRQEHYAHLTLQFTKGHWYITNIAYTLPYTILFTWLDLINMNKIYFLNNTDLNLFLFYLLKLTPLYSSLTVKVLTTSGLM